MSPRSCVKVVMLYTVKPVLSNHKSKTYLWLFRKVVAYGCMKVVQKAPKTCLVYGRLTGLTAYAFCFRPIFTAKLAISGIYLARSLGSNKKHMKHEVYDQALKILTEKSISEINELKDPGMESVKYVQTF